MPVLSRLRSFFRRLFSNLDRHAIAALILCEPAQKTPEVRSGVSFDQRSRLGRLFQSFACRVFQLAHVVLHLADCLFGNALGLHFRVIGHFTNAFLHRTLGLMSQTFNTILVHLRLLFVGVRTMNEPRVCSRINFG